METVADFIFVGFKITADGDCSHEIKRHLLLERKAMTNLDSVLKSRDITLPTRICLVKAIGEGNGNPLQYSCLENLRDRGAWWAAVYGSHRVGHDFMGNRWGNSGNSVRLYFFGLQNHSRW